jgi:hypothetical protein
MGVVIETCIKYPGGPTRIRVTDIVLYTSLNKSRQKYIAPAGIAPDLLFYFSMQKFSDFFLRWALGCAVASSDLPLAHVNQRF